MGSGAAHITYANVMSTIAVFGVLAGGGAYAASKIGAGDIKKNAVRAKHIKKNQVKEKHIGAGAVTADDLACKGNSGQDVMVRAGSVCIDRYENSIWTRKSGGTRITGAIPCDVNGQDCKGKIFARSVKGVPPHTDITWFQAQQALASSGKRLPSNAEWQQAVAGTPDGAPCHVDNSPVGPVSAGTAAGCVSDHGANDMVGNAWEWVGDWVPRSEVCGSWPAGLGGDTQCLAGAATTGAPGALIRGGPFNGTTSAGPFAVDAEFSPAQSLPDFIGFRGAR